LNGKFAGDSDGNFTCFSNDGASLVDYMIASSNLFPYIRNEIFKATLDDIAPVFLALFNNMFSTGNIPSSWRLSVITSIHKSEPSNIPGNHRGISTTNTTCMYKIFSAIIDKRLYDWAEENNKSGKS